MVVGKDVNNSNNSVTNVGTDSINIKTGGIMPNTNNNVNNATTTTFSIPFGVHEGKQLYNVNKDRVLVHASNELLAVAFNNKPAYVGEQSVKIFNKTIHDLVAELPKKVSTKIDVANLMASQLNKTTELVSIPDAYGNMTSSKPRFKQLMEIRYLNGIDTKAEYYGLSITARPYYKWDFGVYTLNVAFSVINFNDEYAKKVPKLEISELASDVEFE